MGSKIWETSSEIRSSVAAVPPPEGGAVVDHVAEIQRDEIRYIYNFVSVGLLAFTSAPCVCFRFEEPGHHVTRGHFGRDDLDGPAKK